MKKIFTFGNRKFKTMKITLSILTFTTLTVFGAKVLYFGTDKNLEEQLTDPTISHVIFENRNIVSASVDSLISSTELKKSENITTDLFRQAYEEIKDMLENRKPISFKRAVFLIDNAYMGGTLNWEWYNQEIKSKLTIFNQMINSAGYGKYKTAKNWAVHTYMTDTTVTPNGYQRYHYDYANYTNDTTGLVYHLLQTHLGNCRSLPYLYKIWCDEYGASAFLATAPMHVYVRQQDENGVWWNLELTSFYRYMPSEDYIAQLEITEEARKSGLYMKSLNEQENLVLCLDDLLRYYIERNDIICDSFVEEVLETAIKYRPISEAQLKRFSCLKYKLDNAMEAKGLNDYSQIEKHPDLIKKFEAMDSVGHFIEWTGYRKISEERYQEMTKETEQKRKKHATK
ncbi:MAG: hypothetical protein M9892_09800 [Bacteroidetes bacterium]|nr:hypothetical protein [Bacteroidota bacterium]